MAPRMTDQPTKTERDDFPTAFTHQPPIYTYSILELMVIMVPSAPAHRRLRKTSRTRHGTRHIAWIPRTEEQATRHVEHALGKGVFGQRAAEHGTQNTGY